MKYELIHGDCLDVLANTRRRWRCSFADIPDNIGLNYEGVNDRRPAGDYYKFINTVVTYCLNRTDVLWLSFNSRHLLEIAHICRRDEFEVKTCVQVFTFGQHRKSDLGNNHRPLWRITRTDHPAELYNDQIRVKSWRQLNGDKRANPDGRDPGDVFDFPRVTGNSKQRRAFCPTQLHEELVERCLRQVCKKGDRVLDPFAGTGATLRVCKKIGLSCTLIEKSPKHVRGIKGEHADLLYTEFGG